MQTNGITPIRSEWFYCGVSVRRTFLWALVVVQISLSRKSPTRDTRCIWDSLAKHWLPTEGRHIQKNKAVDNPIKTCGITSLGPVLTSLHSTAVSLILSRGSSQETPKYMEMDMVCNVRKLFCYIFQINFWPPLLLEGKMAEKEKMQHSNFPMLHKKICCSLLTFKVSFLLPNSVWKSPKKYHQ